MEGNDLNRLEGPLLWALTVSYEDSSYNATTQVIQKPMVEKSILKFRNNLLPVVGK